jgi:proton glutamate symport protein
MSSLALRVLLGLTAGLLLGATASISGWPLLTRVANWLEPLGALFVNAIRMTVLPLVVGSLVAGIAAAPDIRSLGRVGGRALLFFALTLLAGGALTAVLAPPLVSLIPVDIEAARALQAQVAENARPSASQVPTLSRWLVDLVPANPLRAAADSAMLPLIVFTVLFAIAIAALPAQPRTTMSTFFEAVRDAALNLVRWVLAAAPLGVFALAAPLAARLGLAAAGALAGYVGLVALFTTAFVAVVLYPLAATLGRIKITEFVRAVLPAQAVAFSSRSSLASLPAMMEVARSRLGLPDEIAGFLIPLAASVYRVGAAVGQTLGVVFVAHLYQVVLSPLQLASIVLTVVATSFSVPGIPGGSIIIMAPVLMSAGLPVEGVGILLGADTIPDMFRTTANVTGHMTAAVVLGRSAQPREQPSS